MHVLTKIFTVLVALLACMLVPLVVAYAHNEDSYKARYEAESARASAAIARQQTAEASLGSMQTTLQAQISEREGEIRDLKSQLAGAESDLARAEASRQRAEAGREQIVADLSEIRSVLETNTEIREQLLTETRRLRSETQDAKRESIELEAALQQSQSDYEVAVNARRALEEELAQLRREQSAALERVAAYVAAYGDLDDDVLTSAYGGVSPDRDLDTVVLRVRRTSDETLAEIDAGSRDGVKLGWRMIISNDQGYVATLRITEVDINRATGVVLEEDADSRGLVRQGNRVLARRGR